MKTRTIAALIIASVCFCVGLFTVLTGEGTTASSVLNVLSLFPDGVIGPIFPGEEDDRTTILIVGIDRFDRPDPELRAVWLMTIRPPDAQVLLAGVPSNLDLVEGASVPLNSFFAWTPEGGVSLPFIDALERATRTEVDVVAVIDEVAFAALVDYLGGLPFDGGELTGEQVLALNTVFKDDPVGLVRLQASVLENLIPRAKDLGAAPNLNPLLALMPDHAQLSEQPAQFVLLISHLLPLQDDQVRIEVITAPIP